MVLDRQEGLFLSQGVQSVCDLEFRRDFLRFGVYLVVGSARCIPVVLGNVISFWSFGARPRSHRREN